jgi:ribosome biogenesis protein BMS1
MGEEDFPDKKKAHQKRRSGNKAEKKKGKTPHEQELSAKQKNPKAFAIQNVTKVPVPPICFSSLRRTVRYGW